MSVTMWWKTICILTYVSVLVASCEFPPGFKFGAATAAYQVEGAWNVSDKAESIWDNFIHTNPERIADSSSGDVACDSYHQWQKDVEIAEELGLHFYRFSISWPRLMPKGLTSYVSEDGKKYYSDIIDALLEKGIEPIVTLYHWDLPQYLQNLGGWTNPLIADWFGDYARVAFELYGDRVKTWITLNEPLIFCESAYGIGTHAPGLPSQGFGNYICTKNAMLAHAKAWRIYDKEFRHKFHGKVSLTNHVIWLERADENEDEATEIGRHLMIGLFSHPIFSKNGGWPPLIEKLFHTKSMEEGLPRSRFPAFTQKEIYFIRGTYDFYGINYYTSRIVRKAKEGEVVLPWPVFGQKDFNLVLSPRADWKSAGTGWFYIYPEGLRATLRYLKEEYGDLDIMIMENGYASYDSSLDDDDRIQYYKEHLEQVLLAIKIDNINVTAYTAWTMLDNFEWTDGYKSKFGIYQVDFEDPERTRTARASAKYYAQIIRQHSLDVDNVVLNVV